MAASDGELRWGHPRVGGHPRLVLDLGCGPAPRHGAGPRVQGPGVWRRAGCSPAGTPGVCVCVLLCGWVGMCTYVCMCVCTCVYACVCMCVWPGLANWEPPALGLFGHCGLEELVPLPGRRGIRPREHTPVQGTPHPSRLRSDWKALQGPLRPPRRGPQCRGSGAPGPQGSLGPARGERLTLRGSSSFSFMFWLPARRWRWVGGVDWTKRSCSLKETSEIYQPDGPL